MNPNDPKTWPPTVWCLHGYKPKRPERDEHWLSKALAAEMRERKMLATCRACGGHGLALTLDVDGRITLALNERAAERFHVDVHGFAPLRLVVGGAR